MSLILERIGGFHAGKLQGQRKWRRSKRIPSLNNLTAMQRFSTIYTQTGRHGNGAGSSYTGRKQSCSSESIDNSWQRKFKVQPDKLKNNRPQLNEALGYNKMFNNWSSGSKFKADPNPLTLDTSKRFAALDNIDAPERPPSAQSKQQYYSKGSNQIHNYMSNDKSGPRHGSQFRANEGSYTSQRNDKYDFKGPNSGQSNYKSYGNRGPRNNNVQHKSNAGSSSYQRNGNYHSRGPNPEHYTNKSYVSRVRNNSVQHKANGGFSLSQINCKGSSSEHHFFESYDNREPRNRANEDSDQSQRNVPLLATPTLTAVAPSSTIVTVPVTSEKLTEEQLRSLTKSNIDEFVFDKNTFADVNEYIKSKVPKDYIGQMVTDGFLYVLEETQKKRLGDGILFTKLIQKGTISLDDYIKGLTEIVDQADDLQINIGKFWDCLSEILIEPICQKVLPLPRLIKCCEILIGQIYGAVFFASLFKLIINKEDPDFLLNIWKAGGVSFSDFILEDEVAGFIEVNELGILRGDDVSAGQSQ